ncbi:MAG: hypothetical protein SWQ30_23160 [Thermodesulfobacteriota bacterium]|nr:hypothetical protein [Thermodesulfobacteriota bacterium]
MWRLNGLAVVIGIMIASILLGVPCVASSAAPMGFDIGRESLRGLQGVHIIVRKLPASIESKGLTRKHLQEDVESKLNESKIKVLSAKEALFTEGAPSVDLDVKISELRPASEKASGYAYTIAVRLSQGVILSRDPKILLHADTWKVEDFGQAVKLDEIRSRIKEMIDRFVSSYKAANLEKQPIEFSPGSVEGKVPELKIK